MSFYNNEEDFKVRLLELCEFLSKKDKNGIKEDKNWNLIIEHIKPYHDKVFPIIIKNIKKIPAWFLLEWGKEIGDRKIISKALAKTGDAFYILSWMMNFGHSKLMENALIKTKNANMIYNMEKFVVGVDRNRVKDILIEIGEPKWLYMLGLSMVNHRDEIKNALLNVDKTKDSAEFFVLWGEEIGDKEDMFKALLETKNQYWIHYWSRLIEQSTAEKWWELQKIFAGGVT